MKRSAVGLALAALVLAAASAPAADPTHEVHALPNAGFDRLKSLLGTWQGEQDGKPVTISYDLVSGGSALMEKLGPGDEPSMVTLYHPDGSSVLMTHYCGAQNQPRMRAQALAADGKALDFSFVDCSNLAAPDAGHMHHLVITFEDKTRFSQEWTWREKGKEGKTTFHFTRKKGRSR